MARRMQRFSPLAILLAFLSPALASAADPQEGVFLVRELDAEALQSVVWTQPDRSLLVVRTDVKPLSFSSGKLIHEVRDEGEDRYLVVLQPGTHNLLVSSPGFRQETITLNFEPKQVRGLEVMVLSRGFQGTGSLSISSEPSDAGIVIDGVKSAKRTPARFDSIPTGVHQIRVERWNRIPLDTVAAIGLGEESRVHALLQKPRTDAERKQYNETMRDEDPFTTKDPFKAKEAGVKVVAGLGIVSGSPLVEAGLTVLPFLAGLGGWTFVDQTLLELEGVAGFLTDDPQRFKDSGITTPGETLNGSYLSFSLRAVAKYPGRQVFHLAGGVLLNHVRQSVTMAVEGIKYTEDYDGTHPGLTLGVGWNPKGGSLDLMYDVVPDNGMIRVAASFRL